MSFLLLMAVLSVLAYGPQLFLGDRRDWRMPLRHGMAIAFLFTGVDHFVSLESRYLPMMPPYLAGWAVELVLLSGFLEIAGAAGLLMPRAGWRLLGLPDLRPFAGLGLAMLLSVMVLANGHVAASSAGVEGLPLGETYFALRPLFQPLILLWALVCSEAVFPPGRDTTGCKLPTRPAGPRRRSGPGPG